MRIIKQLAEILELLWIYLGIPLGMVVVGAVPMCPRSRDAPGSVSLAKAGLMAVLVLVATGLAVWQGGYLLAWLLWIGDNQHWFYSLIPCLALMLSLCLAAFVVRNSYRGYWSRRSLAILLWPSVIVLALFVTNQLSQDVRRIAGFDPATAALSPFPPSERSTLMLTAKTDSSESCRTYAVVAEEPRGQVRVCRRRWWWTVARFEKYEPSAMALERAQKLLEAPQDSENGIWVLRQIVERYPGTSAASRAQELLQEPTPHNTPLQPASGGDTEVE